ncbi:apoptosis-inducing factor 3 isoform X2 [Copidosoma floridanum]|uniref:apoptosis-inducing factor 3 isoform X2 n=1 Tax=Copidosoma floridanum TaxID=29053 RepID=UPI0006C95FF4|nr:apoptosis-inducing factor 3 isoform X2 [Copidosoma floridanum]XP_014213818.1 apoptosis-inducing factor 3 isoform X2 [Copidosoma floridanum]
MSGKVESVNYIEDVVCKEEDIKENEMKLLPLGTEGRKILLIKQKGELHAIGTKCTHYGALLHTGALGEGRVRCPWHGACFNIKTGDIEDYPGLDSLPCYQVSVEKGQVRVKAKITDLVANRKTKKMCKLNPGHPETVVIVGGGTSGATCAETLRQEYFEGRIVMVCKENVLPYDRVKVSKVLDFDVQKALLRSKKFYDENNIETKLGVSAVNLDTEKQTICLDNGEQLHYDHLFIATGCIPRQHNVQGMELQNIFVMRSYTDSEAVFKQLGSDKHVVTLGLGFVGLETAAYCADKVASVTVIGRDSVPFSTVFGEDIGKRVMKEFEEKGVKFIANNGICKFLSREDNKQLVGQIELNDGVVLKADIVILGIGSTFSTDWLKETGIHLQDDGSVTVDKHLRTNIHNIYAGGDIAYAPVYAAGKSAAIGHFSLAHYHGKVAAQNICKKGTSLKTVPFFWTTLFGKSYRYSGFGKPEKIMIHGSLEDLKFFAYYIKSGEVVAMSSLGTDPIVADFANNVYEGKVLTEEEIEKDPIGWMRHKPKDFQPAMKSISSQQTRSYHTLTLQRLVTKKFINTQPLKYSKIIGTLTYLRKLIL